MKETLHPLDPGSLGPSGLGRTSCIRGQRVYGEGTPSGRSACHVVDGPSPPHRTRNRASLPSPDASREAVAPVAVAIAWDEGGQGVICQSSSEIAGSPRNLLQEASHSALRRRTAPGRTDLGPPPEPGVGGQVLGAKVEDPTGKTPTRWGRFLSGGSVMARRPRRGAPLLGPPWGGLGSSHPRRTA